MYRLVKCSKYLALSILLLVTSWSSATEDGNLLHSSKRSKRSIIPDPVDEEHDTLESDSDSRHASEWTVKLEGNDLRYARELAAKYGFNHVSDIEGIHGLFRFIRQDHSQSEDITGEEDTVESKTAKRDHIESAKRLASDTNIHWIRREKYLVREKRVPLSQQDYFLDSDSKKSFDSKIRHVRTGLAFNDPKFNEQWYVRNVGQTSGPAHFDSHVYKVWEMGYTGNDVRLSVLDDGMDHTHPDLVNQYDPLSSKDLNGHDDDPFPNDSDPYNAHGTKCSGTIAAEANNSICGVGIAYGSKVGAIRMLDGKATDSLEADALSFHRDHIDLYSCSWGPKDNGATFGRPGKLGRIALEQGAKLGRKGKGSIFVWATGNGGIMHDDCNADGYVNSIYTIGIGSANEFGVSTYYGEKCSASMAVTYCSGQHSAGFNSNQNRANVITTYLHHQCTDHFVGTSSAAPLAAAIFALVLEANPTLTWRDMQHLIYETARRASPLDVDWKKNGCGRWYNHKFGFGVLNAHKMVMKSLNWTSVAKQRACHFRLNFQNGTIPSGHHFKLNFTTDGCQTCSQNRKDSEGKCANGIDALEHAVVNVTLKHRCRGHLNIDLISPSGTISHLLHLRPNDNSDKGLKGWSFMTVFNWCENPSGTWQIVFRDNLKIDSDIPQIEKKSTDMEEVYIRLLERKKKSALLKRTEEVEDGDEGFSDDQVEKLKRYLAKKQGDLLLNYASGNKDQQTRSGNYKRDFSAADDAEFVANRKYFSGYDTGDNDEGYQGYQVERSYGRKKRSYEREQEDEDTDRSANQKRSVYGEGHHKCDSQMRNPALMLQDVAGEVTGITVTLYGTRK